MVELYTKRNFRCDCGIGRLSMVKCNLDRLKFEKNDANIYNQNFSGLYCVCHRPYPDAEDPIDDEMIQCVVCEDWFHCRHLVSDVPRMTMFTEMICQECTAKHAGVLMHYMKFSVSEAPQPTKVTAADETEAATPIDVGTPNADVGEPSAKVTTDEEKMETAVVADTGANEIGATDEKSTSNEKNTSNEKSTIDEEYTIDEKECTTGEKSTKTEKESLTAEEKTEEAMDQSANGTANGETGVDGDKPVDELLKDEINQCIADIIEINKQSGDSNDESNDEKEPPAKRQKLSDTTTAIPQASAAIDGAASMAKATNCKKPARSTRKVDGATYWPVEWRTNICSCADCMAELRSANIEFLTDLEDTVLCYEEKGLAKARESQYDTGMKELSRMNHVQKVDVIMGYNKMKEKLTEFLNAFVTNNQVVTEEDINRFFRMLKDKKEGGGADGGKTSSTSS